MHKQSVSLPKRSREYGVGKEIGGAVYVHRTYEHLLSPPVSEAKRHLPADFSYTVVKYRRSNSTFSFIYSPDFDTSPEPIVGNVCTVTTSGQAVVRRQPEDPYIYHHKWLFVADDYPGFDVKESKARSEAWNQLDALDRRRIGRRSYWERRVLPRLQGRG